MTVPPLVTAVIVGLGLSVVPLVGLVAYAGGRQAGLSPFVNRRLTTAVVATLSLWLLVALVLTQSGLYRIDPGDHFPWVALALFLPIAMWWIALQFPSPLTSVLDQPLVQMQLVGLLTARVIGAVFLILLAQGKLPALWAVPAGVGDVVVGLTAPIAAAAIRRPHWQGVAVAWNLLGLLDFAVVVAIGFLAAPGEFRLLFTEPSTQLLSVFPLALFPAFLVPAATVVHIASLRYLRGQREATRGERRTSTPA